MSLTKERYHKEFGTLAKVSEKTLTGFEPTFEIS